MIFCHYLCSIPIFSKPHTYRKTNAYTMQDLTYIQSINEEKDYGTPVPLKKTQGCTSKLTYIASRDVRCTYIFISTFVVLEEIMCQLSGLTLIDVQKTTMLSNL